MSQQQAPASHPILINLPPPPSNPDTPSEVPGTPTSTTTSLSALSTTAIKDGHRGALHHRGHQHSPSANSLEAERADRISRLTGLSGVPTLLYGASTLRGPPIGVAQHNANSIQTTATSSGFPLNPIGGGLTPAYFDAAGQPVAVTKVSTVGSASGTESIGEQTTTTTEVGGYQSTLADDRDEDMFVEIDSISASGYVGYAMDEDLDNLASRSVGGYEDRMSDDGSASLVGFGEGAGSTLSGPIYHRRPPATQGSAAGTGPAAIWQPERSGSGHSDGVAASLSPRHSTAGARRDLATRSLDREAGTDTPASQTAIRERREARMMDGVAVDTNTASAAAAAPTAAAAVTDDVFIDTTTRGPVPVPSPAAGTVRERQQQQQQLPAQTQYPAPSSTREAAERIIRESLDEGEGRVDGSALGSPRGGEPLGRFYFEKR